MTGIQIRDNALLINDPGTAAGLRRCVDRYVDEWLPRILQEDYSSALDEWARKEASPGFRDSSEFKTFAAYKPEEVERRFRERIDEITESALGLKITFERTFCIRMTTPPTIFRPVSGHFHSGASIDISSAFLKSGGAWAEC